MTTYICKACGVEGSAVNDAPSSFVAELLVWLVAIMFTMAYSWLFLIIAFGFSLWRYSRIRRRCRKCKSPDIIPIDSPLGRALQAQLKRGEVPVLREEVR